MSIERNMEYARLAAELGVDVLEAGFPAASSLDFQIVNEIAAELSTNEDSPLIAALCQLRDEQIDRTIESLMPAVARKKGLLHVYLPVDPELMEASLGARANDKAGLVADVHAFVMRAAKAGLEVEFSPEGYSRQGKNFEFVTDVIRAAVDAGATVINCPDTIGGASIYEGENYFVNLMNRHAEIVAKEFPGRTVIWSAHCHNDYGLALQNSLNAVFDGPARQIEGCINGIGERAGNVALEQCIVAIKNMAPLKDPKNPLYTRAKTELLQKASDFVSKHMLPRQPHQPVVGDNAAKHSSGGHTNAVLKNPLVYHPFDPREVGKDITFLFGPLSGGNHAKSIIEGFGYICDESEKVKVSQFIKDLYSQRRKGITDQELLRGYFEYRKPINVDRFDYAKSANKAEIKLHGKFFTQEGEIHEELQGRDSALAALKLAVDRDFGKIHIESHRSESDSQGINAKSVSKIIIVDEKNDRYEGTGEDHDIEISAMRALIDAVNIAYIERNFRKSASTNAAGINADLTVNEKSGAAK